MPENLDGLSRRNGSVAVIHDPSRFLRVLRQFDSNSSRLPSGRFDKWYSLAAKIGTVPEAPILPE
jgi:hypothetical protein